MTPTRGAAGLAAVALILALAGVGVAAARSATAGSTAHSAVSLTMCRNTGTAPPVKHVVVMFLENERYGHMVGNPKAPYVNDTLTAQCGVATNAYAATHDSAANYLALSAGQYPAKSASGCGTVATCRTSVPSLYSQMAAAGLGWRDFVERAPKKCDPRSVPGVTKIGHDPALFYPNINCANDVVPVASLTSAGTGPFWTELSTDALPGFTWISPDQDHVGENGSTVASQDNFLRQFVTKFVASAAYQSGTTALVITEDEGDGPDTKVGEDCTNRTKDLAGQQVSCHVPLWVVYPYNPGTNDSTFFDPYSVTRGTEDLFGMSHLAHAADTKTNSIDGHFGLTG